jgi:lipoyl(octanoyl) transferase
MTYPRATWRLIITPAHHGAFNMALDEAILEATVRREAPPTLRLYSWEPACLSLGHAQPIADVDLEALHANGWEQVRRPTGGRAILHVDELTYSVTGRQDEPRLDGNVLDSYQKLSLALLNALKKLGIDAQALVKIPDESSPNPVEASTPKTPKNQNPVCFEVPSNYEITFDGKKLIGSAQSRRNHGVLQHGSLPLHGDLRRITQALAFPSQAQREEAAQRLLQRATTAERILGRALPWDPAAQAIIAAFEETLNLRLETSELTPGELQRAGQLMQEKYANTAWTERL